MGCPLATLQAIINLRNETAKPIGATGSALARFVGTLIGLHRSIERAPLGAKGAKLLKRYEQFVGLIKLVCLEIGNAEIFVGTLVLGVDL